MLVCSTITIVIYYQKPQQVRKTIPFIDISNNNLYGIHLETNIKLRVFTQNYAKLMDILPVKSLTPYFIKEKLINFDEEEIILQKASQPEAAGIVLRKIGHSLETNSTSFDILLSIMEQYGGTSCVELVNEMRQHLQDTTGKLLRSYVARL